MPANPATARSRSRQLDATCLLPSVCFGQQRLAYAQFLLKFAGLDALSEAAAWPAFAASSCPAIPQAGLACCQVAALLLAQDNLFEQSFAANSQQRGFVRPGRLCAGQLSQFFRTVVLGLPAVSDSASRSRSVSNFASSL